MQYLRGQREYIIHRGSSSHPYSLSLANRVNWIIRATRILVYGHRRPCHLKAIEDITSAVWTRCSGSSTRSSAVTKMKKTRNRPGRQRIPEDLEGFDGDRPSTALPNQTISMRLIAATVRNNEMKLRRGPASSWNPNKTLWTGMNKSSVNCAKRFAHSSGKGMNWQTTSSGDSKATENSISSTCRSKTNFKRLRRPIHS